MRDESATLRDEVAVLRDEVADLRDAEPDPGEQTAEPSGGPDAHPGEGESPEPVGGTRDDTATREGSAAAKDQAADRHDADAADRDQQARDRDQAAEQRDQAARDAEREQDVVTIVDVRSRAEAVTARDDAASDRRGSEQDRQQAADERTAASLDALTGAYARGPGMTELERDRSRAERTGEPMTLAFVDVDDLKGTNDRAGHPAGDRLLRQVADVLKAHIRPHDVILRYGGDEFVCALMGLTAGEADERLADASERGSITVGVAQLETDESLSSLIERADAALYRKRRQP